MSIGFVQDWTAEFVAQRSGAIGATLSDTTLSAIPIAEAPQWSIVVDEINDGIAATRRQMAELHATQKRYLNVDTEDPRAIEQEMDRRTYETKRSIKELQNRVVRFAQFKEIDSPTVVTNIQSRLAADVNQLADDFKQQNKQFLVSLKSRIDKFSDCFTEETDASSYHSTFDDDQRYDLTQTEEKIVERVAEIKKISKTVQELAEITTQLHTLVFEQGTIVDQIDFNITHTEHHVKHAVEEIKVAEKHQKATRVKIIVLILLVLIMIGIIALVVKVCI